MKQDMEARVLPSGTTDHVIAVDIGTGSCRAVLFSPDGQQVGIAQREYAHRPEPDVPGSLAFDCARVWNLICECIREVVSSAAIHPTAVRAISATSMREGMVLYDGAGRELWACPNVDARATDEAAHLISTGEAFEIFTRAGDWVAITAPARFKWLARHRGEIFGAIRHVGMLADWALTKLSGEFVTDPSVGSSSGMFDLAKRTWSEQILDICELDPSVFPAVESPGTVIGNVSPQAASETGLRPGTPVVLGGADTQMGLVGIGARPGDFTIVGGSFWQHTMLVEAPLVDRDMRVRTLCHAIDDQWMVEGIGFYCGIVMRWFRDAFCEVEKAAAAAAGTDVYELLERQAAQIPPGANGVVGLFSNVMHAKRWVHTTPGFIGFDIGDPNGSPRIESFRAIEECAAYVSRAHRGIVEEVSGRGVSEAVLTGGAAKGSLWPQIVADVLAIPVSVPRVKESTALGAAICASAGAGLGISLGAGGSATPRAIERTFEPHPVAVEAYADLFEKWTVIYERSMPLAEDGLARPLWRAAGA